MNEAFVYCWTDLSNNKLYIGVHKGTPDDGYVCSSKIVLQEHRKRRTDFIREIIAQGTWEDCYALETAILRSAGADKDSGFYNQHVNTIQSHYYTRHHTEEWKQNHSEKMKILFNRPERKQAISDLHKGKKHRLGKKESLESREKKRLMRLGKIHSQETKDKIRLQNSKRWKITFPTGESVIIINLSQFCREHKLNIGHMANRGKTKGYTCDRLEETT